jgi:hypothetical protein
MIEEMDKEYKNPVKSHRELEVNIDFDDASQAWRANKQSLRNGSFKYICEAKTKMNESCKKKPLQGSSFCNVHQCN